MKYIYYTSGTCSSQIDLEIEGDKLKNVVFYGGCDGNLKGLSRLLTGMSCEDVISKLEGIRCGYKSTSCPDQLAKALKEALGSNEQ